VCVIGGAGQDVLGTTNADNVTIGRVDFQFCGLGLYFQGSDANGYRVDYFWGIHLGTLVPTPDIASGASYEGLGGHNVHCHSQASGRISAGYAQLSSGMPILKTGLGRMGLGSVFQELNDECFSKNTGGVVIDQGSGNLTWSDDSTGVLQLEPSAGGRGIIEKDASVAYAITATLIRRGQSSCLAFASSDDTPNSYSWHYGNSAGYGLPRGYWGLKWSFQSERPAFVLSAAYAGLDLCPGWLVFPFGYFHGRPGIESPIFDGHTAVLPFNDLRAGVRKKNDRFRSSANTEIVLTSDGYRGRDWAAATTYTEGTSIIPPDMI
jgi:hypothetical protein